MKKLILFISILSIFGCKDAAKSQEKIPTELNNGIGDGAVSPPMAFAQNIEHAHNKAGFMKNEAVSFNIELEFGGQTRLDARVSMLTNSTKVKVVKKNGEIMVYNGEDMKLFPDSLKTQSARFDLFTWQYFFSMPFKLTDAGTKWETQKPGLFNNQLLQRAKLSFEKGTGDSPDDWYVVYQDPESRRLKAAAYIVTYGDTSRKKAEENPHAIVYENYEKVDGVPFATQWNFYNWNSEKGFGEKLGEAKISEIKFFKPEPDYFSISKSSN